MFEDYSSPLSRMRKSNE